MPNTYLPNLSQRFLIALTTNGYTPRAVDVNFAHQNVLNTSYACINKGVTNADMSSGMNFFYQNIGTTLTSQSLNLITPAVSPLIFANAPTANNGTVTYNGSTQSASTAATSQMPLGTVAGSICCFFKLASNVVGEIFGVGGNVGAGSRAALFYNADNNLYVENAGVHRRFAWTFDTNWHFLAVTWGASSNTTTQVMYFDGTTPALTSSSSASINIFSGALSVANIPVSGGAPFNGQVANEMVFKRQITSAEATQIWNTQKGKFGL